MLAGTAQLGLPPAGHRHRRAALVGAYALVAVLCLYTNATLVLLALPQAAAGAVGAPPGAVPVAGLARRRSRVAGIPLALLTLGASAVNPLFRVPTPARRRRAGLRRADPGRRRPGAPAPGARVPASWRPARSRGWRLRDRPARPRRARGGSRSRGWSSPSRAPSSSRRAGDSIWLTRYLIATVPAACLLIAWSVEPGRPARRAPAGRGDRPAHGVRRGRRLAHRGEPIGEWAAAVAAARPPGRAGGLLRGRGGAGRRLSRAEPGRRRRDPAHPGLGRDTAPAGDRPARQPGVRPPARRSPDRRPWSSG